MKKEEIIEKILTGINKMTGELDTKKTEIVNDIQATLDKGWLEYSAEKQKFEKQKTTGDAQAMKEQLVVMKQKIDAVNSEAGGLSTALALKYNITVKIPDINLSVDEEVAFVSNQIKRLDGEAYDITSDNELKEELDLVKKAYVDFKAKCKEFRTEVANFNNTYGEGSLGSTEVGNIKDRFKVQELGKEANGIIGQSSKHIKTIQASGKPLEEADVQLLDEIGVEKVNFTKEFFATMRGGKKSKKFTAPEDKVKDEASALEYIKDLDISTADVLSESSKLKHGLFDSIMRENATYNKALAKGLDKVNVEDLRKLLIDINLKCAQWLAKHKDAKSGSKQAKQASQIKTLQPLIKKHIAIVGALAINKDNFLEIKTSYQEETKVVAELEELIAGNTPKGMTSEEYTTRIKSLKQRIQEGIKKCSNLSSDWLNKHKGDVARDNKLNDLARDLNMRAYKVLGEETPTNKYTPKKPYDKAKDKKLSSIKKKVTNAEGKQSSTKYENRFTKLGDLNNAIQKWKFDHKYYEGEAIDKAREEVKKAETFLETEYDVINTQMSMKALEKGFDERLNKYHKWVSEYNNDKGGNEEARDKKFPQIIEGSAAIIEFIDTWNDQYTKLQKTNVPIPTKTEGHLKELKVRYEKIKKTIEDSNFSVLTRMVDPSLEGKVKDMTKEAEVKGEALNDKKQQQSDIEVKINKLKIEITKLGLDIQNSTDDSEEDNFRDELSKKEEELRELDTTYKDIGGDLDVMQTAVDNLKLQAEQLSKRFENQKKRGATVIYLTITDLYEKGKANKSFDYEPELDLATETQKRHYINNIMELIRNWNKEVVDPSLEYLEPYVRTLKGIQTDLELQVKQFNEKKAFVDKNYNNILKSYEAIQKGLKANDISLEALQELKFCQKLIGYWFKENAVETGRNKEKRKRLAEIKVFVVSEIGSTRFLALKEADEAAIAKKNLETLLKETKETLEKRMKEFASEDIYNANTPDIGAELTKSEGDINYLFRKINKGLTTEVASFLSKNNYRDAINEMVQLENQFVSEYKKLQVKLHEALVAKEKLIFVSVSGDDFDYETSGQYSPEEIALMTKTIENISDRARAILKAGGTPEEAEKMFEHIPVALWPDQFVSELQAFRSVEAALEEEARGGAAEKIAEEQKALGLTNLFKDVGTMGAEGVKNLADKFAEINGMLWDDDENEAKDGYDTISVFDTTKKQSDGFKQFVNGVDLASIGIDLGLSTIDFVGKTKEDIANLKMERAQAFLFEGKVNFGEDGSGEFEQDPAKNTVAQKKRMLVLMGLKFAAETSQKVSTAISGSSDAHGGPDVLTAITKDIAAVFGALAAGIEMATDDNLARTTQEVWDKNFDRLTRITKGLLSAGVTVAETVAIFQVIPGEVLPGLGIATGAVELVVDVYGIAKVVLKLAKTKQLLDEAKIHDRAYVGPLEQEMTGLKRKIAKQSVDTAADVVTVAGGVVGVTLAATGVASAVSVPVGAAIALVAGVMKVGNAIVFEAINEAQMKLARDLLKKARKGDREAQTRIMKESPVYAKMFIAIGATDDPPNPIALEFVRQRGLTERDTKDEATSKWVIRKFIRTKLLEASEEADNHEGKLGPIKGLIKRIEMVHARSQKRHGFWEGKVDQSFKLVTELYSTNELEKMVLDFTKHVSALKKENSKTVKKFLAVQVAFDAEFVVVGNALDQKMELLKGAIKEDKKSKDKDLSIQIQKLEREKGSLSLQQDALSNILEILEAVKKIAA